MPPAPDSPPPRPPALLSVRLREATAGLHREVEASPLIAALLDGQLPVADYARLLRQLQPLYAALETRLATATALPAALRAAPLRRQAALEADLDTLLGPCWPDAPVLEETADYAAHLLALDERRLVAHAYVRYLGDLAGGRLLARSVTRLLARDDGRGTAFYAFPPPGPVALAAAFRSALDELAHDAAGQQALVDEAGAAFRRHAVLFAALYPRR